jgi:hypothetical protein
MYNKEKYKTTFNIDKVNHPDTEVIKFCGKEMPLGEVRKLYEGFEESRYNMMSFYDDMFQYTSLGLLDLAFDIYHINSPIPYKQFFKRREIYGKHFVYKTLERFHISKEEIDGIEREYYEEILLRSPISHNAKSYFKIRDICREHLLIMAYPFKISSRFVRFIQETFGKDEFISLEIDYRNNKTEEEYLKTLPKSRYNCFDIVICQDAASLIEFVVDKDITNSQILTPFDHCGLSPEAKFTFEAYLEGTGPNNCKLNYVKEEVE